MFNSHFEQFPKISNLDLCVIGIIVAGLIYPILSGRFISMRLVIDREESRSEFWRAYLIYGAVGLIACYVIIFEI